MRKEGRHALVWIVMLGMAFALRVWGLEAQSLWRDEVDTVRFATQPLPALLRMFITPGHNGALYYLLIRPWALFFGPNDFALRYTAVLGGVMAVALTYRVLRRWVGQEPATLAALFMAVSPYAIWYSQELRMYAWILALALAATWCWMRAFWDGQNRFWVLYVTLMAAGIYMHFLLALLIPTHFLLTWLFPHRLRARWPAVVLAYLSFTLPYWPLAWWQQKLLFSPTFQTGHPFVPWPEMIIKLLTVFSSGIHRIALPGDLPQGLVVSPLLFLVFSGLLLSPETHVAGPGSWPRRAGLAGWFLLPTVGLYLISLELPLFTERYLIWTMPAVYGLAALGAWQLIRRHPAGWFPLALSLVLFVVGIGYQVRYPIKPDMRGVTTYVESQRGPGSKVLLHLGYLIHAYTYYAPDSRPALVEAPAPGPLGTLEQTGQDLLRRLGGATEVWLVESESAMWDPKGLVRQWLDQNAEVLEDRQFVGIRVTRYRLPSKNINGPP